MKRVLGGGEKVIEGAKEVIKVILFSVRSAVTFVVAASCGKSGRPETVI